MASPRAHSATAQRSSPRGWRDQASPTGRSPTVSVEVLGDSFTPLGSFRQSTGSYGSPRAVLTSSQEYQLGQLEGHSVNAQSLSAREGSQPGPPTQGVQFSQGAAMQALQLPADAGDGAGRKIISLQRSAAGTVGILFYRPGNAPMGPFHVNDVVPSSPAEACGLIRSGDMIQQVDAQDVHGLTVDDMSKLLCGQPHTTLTLAVDPGPSKSPHSSASDSAFPPSFMRPASAHETTEHVSPHATQPGSGSAVNGFRTEQVTRDNSGALGIQFARSPQGSLTGSSGPVEVVGLTDGGAARNSGALEPGDLIYEVNGQSVTGLSVHEVSQLLRGPPTSPVKLVLGRTTDSTGSTDAQHDIHLRLTLALKPATAGADGSRQRRAFEEVLLQELAVACGHPAECFKMVSIDVTADTIFVVSIAPNRTAPTTSPNAAAHIAALYSAISSGSAGTITSNCVKVECVKSGQNPGPESPASPPTQQLGSASPRQSIGNTSSGRGQSVPVGNGSAPNTRSAAPASVPTPRNQIEEQSGVDVSLVLGLDFSHAGQEGTEKRANFKKQISEDLAFASGWEREQSEAGQRIVPIERSSQGLGMAFSVPSLQKQQVPFLSFSSSFSSSPPPSGEQRLASAKIKAVSAGSPAAANGLKEGDRIYAIDGNPIVTSMASEEIAAMLRGAPGTTVCLRVGPPGDNPTKGLPPECFFVKNLMPGSVCVDATVLPQPTNKGESRPHPSSIAADLASQAHDPASRLRTGSLTRHVQSLTVQSTPGQSTKPAPASAPEESGASRKSVSVVRSDEGGVGLRFTRSADGPEKGPFYVYDVTENGPAHKTGQINVGDAIHEVDGHAVQDLGLEETMALMRGPPASTVTFVLHHDPDGQAMVKEVKRCDQTLHDPLNFLQTGQSNLTEQQKTPGSTKMPDNSSSVYSWRSWGSPADGSSANSSRMPGV